MTVQGIGKPNAYTSIYRPMEGEEDYNTLIKELRPGEILVRQYKNNVHPPYTEVQDEEDFKFLKNEDYFENGFFALTLQK